MTVIAAGTTPPPPGTPYLVNPQLGAKLDYAHSNSDSLVLTGALSTFDSTTMLAGLVATINVGGVTQSYTLDGKGNASITNGSFTFSATSKAFVAKLVNGSFTSTWVLEGIDPTATVPLGNTVFPVTVTIQWGGL